ncbi:MAG: PadR family transcriptional regulator [Candidatus Humimicrobiaceae bacterium]
MIREFFLGFIKIHILHHAAEKEVYGLWLIEELERHGYKLSPGTLYPILHSLEKQQFLAATSKNIKGKIRKYYTITNKGREALAEAKLKINELIREVLKE